MMWSLLPGADAAGELCLDDLMALTGLLASAREAANRPDAKSIELAEVLHRDVPTLVYVTARETITYLRRHLPDRWLAWCSGQRAGIGATTLPREEVLRWFRPDAPPHPPGVPGRPKTLVTTDVTAEGLDLQGAGRVVHYDLPWTDVRLAQRDGRAIRRGSTHATVDVIRFLPDRRIERRLRQMSCLTRKSALPAQGGLGPGGRSKWRWRGELAESLTGVAVEGVCAVRASSAGALAGVSLEREGRPAAPAVFARTEGSSWRLDAEEIRARLHEAGAGMPLSPPSRMELDECLATLAPHIRSLLRGASQVRVGGLPLGAAALALGKRLRRLAAEAARQRDADLLGVLEHALGFCTRGHTAGEAMLIESLLSLSSSALLARLEHLPPAPTPATPLRPRLTGLIVFRRT
jgi:hypothetical protein